MEITLEKIDQVRDRTGVSYKESKEALEAVGGNVIDAIIYIEEMQNNKWTDNISGVGNDVVEKLKDIVKKGNVTKIVLKRDEEIIMNIPVTVGAVGAVLSLPATMVGILAALAAKCKIEIVKTDGEIVDINEMAGETLENVKSVAEDTFSNVKSKVDGYKNKGNVDKKDVDVDLSKDEDKEE
ncbi:DUF4342 domain-containing protein [Marinisporobacter balticus]|uniref:Uncharacterized protein DUF4342 n=1 Tax=Marinisporobacter balticus TaxID=2018667 RepID=A0A4V2SCN6_9FIRM|nr:DUF4342 domain-containing protein [Marinisporobacter balticus]TCO80030.1 uncharacterized protein DUF4342 [Marinisporobacter balticus]